MQTDGDADGSFGNSWCRALECWKTKVTRFLVASDQRVAFWTRIRARVTPVTAGKSLGILHAASLSVESALTNVLRRAVLPAVPVIMVGTSFLPSTPNAAGEQAGRVSS